MLAIHRRTPAIAAAAALTDPDALLAAPEPVIIKGLVADWPLVQAGREGAAALLAYIARFDAGLPVTGYTAPAEIGGRFFYDDAMTGFNFARERVGLRAYLERIAADCDDPSAPSYYLGSTDLAEFLPGLADANPMPLAGTTLTAHPPLASIWVGTRTTASAHWDMSNNIAACAAGRRRFTLFPADQVHNLYPGPLEPTPGGQVVSMVDFAAPDPERYPRFADAVAAAQVAELEPGDVLIYPALWWHHVEALGSVNVLVNYWWNDAPAQADPPMTTLLHALLSLRDRPLAEKQAWRELFDFYVFGPADRAAAHLPPHARGALDPLDPAGARRLRANVLQRLNR